MLGCRQEEMASYVTWANLVAASGMAALTYTTNELNAESLGIDECRIGIWAFSGNVPNAMSLLISDAGVGIKCAALCYPYTLDDGNFADVAGTSKTFGFVNPTVGKSEKDLKLDLPLLIVRGGGQSNTDILEV